MANFAASDVTYTISKIKKLEDGRKIVNATISFGDGVLTYATGGVPITIGKLGCPVSIDSMAIIGNAGVGYVFQYDAVNAKLMMLASTTTAAHVHDLLYIGGITATEPVAIQGGDTLGKNAATNRTIAGANSATKGGVVSAGPTATSLSEPNGVAIAAQSISVSVIGW